LKSGDQIPLLAVLIKIVSAARCFYLKIFLNLSDPRHMSMAQFGYSGRLSAACFEPLFYTLDGGRHYRIDQPDSGVFQGVLA